MFLKIIFYQIIFFILMYIITLFYFTVKYYNNTSYEKRKDFEEFKNYINKNINFYFLDKDKFDIITVFFLLIPFLGFFYTIAVFLSIFLLEIKEKLSNLKNIFRNLLKKSYESLLKLFFNFFIKEYNELKEFKKQKN